MNISQSLRRCALCLVALPLVFSVSSVNAQQAADAWPEWLQKAMAEESHKLKSSKVSVGDGFLKSRLAGKPNGQPQAMEGGWYLSSNIGTPAPLECWIFSATIDPATMAANIANVSMQASEQANGALGMQSIYFVDAGAYESAPYLALEWMYSVGEAPKTLIGLAKVRVARLNGVTLACAHNLPGYRQTFANAFEEFVRESDYSSEEPPHYYEEVIVQKFGEQPVGIAHSTFTRDEEGDTAILTVESVLIPVDASTLSTSDSWHSSFSRADGTLLNQVFAKSENGELTMQLSLDPADNGDWLVSGTYQGKDISQEISGAVQPMSEIGQMYAVQNLLADDERSSVTLDIWLPDADPTRFLQAGVTLETDDGRDGYGTLTLGPMAIAAQFDASGSLLSGRMQAGAMDMTMERVWAGGSPP